MTNLRQQIIDVLSAFNYTVKNIDLIATRSAKFATNWTKLTKDYPNPDNANKVLEQATMDENLVIMLTTSEPDTTAWLECEFDGMDYHVTLNKKK